MAKKAKKSAKAAKKTAAKAKAKKPARKARRESASRKVATAKPAKVPGKLKLTIMTGQYDIVRALYDGRVQPKGIELVAGAYPGTRSIHDQVAHGKACDINE